VIALWGLNKKRLGDILLDAGLINNDQLSEVLAEQKISGKKIGEILIEKGYVTKKKITEALEQQLGIPYVNLVQNVPEADVIRLVPENIARRHEIIPVKLENNVLTVAAADPLNITAFDDVRIFTGYEIQPAIADSDAIENLLSRFYSTQKAAQAVEEFSKANELFARDMYNLRARMDELGNLNDSPAVRLINILFDQAIQNGASDIHIEPQGKYLRVRFRIDGQLQDIMRSDMDILPSLISRIKVMAGMNIAEKRLPQDGRISYKIGQDEVDLRISVLPTMHGEKAVVRLIGKNTFNIPKDQLGFLPENLAALESMLKSPHGIILVTGPTGSGKTTTLYTAVKELNKPEINIVTVEDPVESIIEGITQVQENFL
jgi:type IV pilus assembly protein PilB